MKLTTEEMRSAMASNRLSRDYGQNYTFSLAVDAAYFLDENVPYCFGNMMAGELGYKHQENK